MLIVNTAEKTNDLKDEDSNITILKQMILDNIISLPKMLNIRY